MGNIIKRKSKISHKRSTSQKVENNDATMTSYNVAINPYQSFKKNQSVGVSGNNRISHENSKLDMSSHYFIPKMNVVSSRQYKVIFWFFKEKKIVKEENAVVNKNFINFIKNATFEDPSYFDKKSLEVRREELKLYGFFVESKIGLMVILWEVETMIWCKSKRDGGKISLIVIWRGLLMGCPREKIVIPSVGAAGVIIALIRKIMIINLISKYKIR